MKVNALFVESGGVYSDLENIIPWDIVTDAFICNNGAPAICHPPCKRWGRYWSGGPSVKVKKLMGDDSQGFAFCLWYVRTFGGVIEHPEGSHAFRYYGISRPKQGQGWIKADDYGGLVCSVAQGNYGHRSRKMTWLYLNGFKSCGLNWAIPKGLMRIEEGRIKVKRESEDFVPVKRISSSERIGTPIEFRDLLIGLVS